MGAHSTWQGASTLDLFETLSKTSMVTLWAPLIRVGFAAHIREGAGAGRMCLGKRRLHSLAIHTVAVMLTVRQVAPW